MNPYRQIQVELVSDVKAKVYLRLPHLKYRKLLGKLSRETKTFRTINRNYENLFHLFGSSGLGINTEILNRLNFEFIEIPYNNEVLKTTREHFIKHSIPSPFVSNKVDPQRILKISDFVIPVEVKKEMQAEMFEELV